jgi:hypothetical protein
MLDRLCSRLQASAEAKRVKIDSIHRVVQPKNENARLLCSVDKDFSLIRFFEPVRTV